MAARLTQAARTIALVTAAAALTLLPACSWWSDATYPIPPTSQGSDETAVAYEHFVQVSWNSTDLALLESMDIQYPSDVVIVPSADPSPSGDELQIEIHFDVENDNDSSYSQAFIQQIQAASSLNAQNAQYHVPAPQHPCQETYNSEGQITGLQGVCVRALVISLPASHPIPISVAPGGDFSASGVTVSSLLLALPSAQTNAQINTLIGDLTVTGGSPSSTLVVSQVGDLTNKTGNLTLNLNAIQSAKLSEIGGSVSISIAHPPTQSGAITLDGTAITTFPFSRP